MCSKASLVRPFTTSGKRLRCCVAANGGHFLKRRSNLVTYIQSEYCVLLVFYLANARLLPTVLLFLA